MNGIFITGTDTGVGKTIITGCLAKYLLDNNHNVITQKWIQTGCVRDFSSDIKLHLKIMGKDKNYIRNYLSYICPYIFKTASSPHLASQIEHRKIDINKIINSFKLLSKEFDFVLVEGIGGALVPLDKNHLVIDIVKELNLPALVVVQNKLGAINHTLLTVEALEARKINILGLVFNNYKDQNREVLIDNTRIIKVLTNEMCFGILPWIATSNNFSKLYQRFIPIAAQIFKRTLSGSCPRICGATC